MRQFLLPQRMHTRQVDFASDDLRPGGREHFSMRPALLIDRIP